MPTYEYECKKCGNRFEKFQAIKDLPLTMCESCGGQVRRIVSGGAGVIFKGSGFYMTDKNGNKPAVKSSKEKSTENVKQAKNDKPESCAACPASAVGVCKSESKIA